MLQLKSVPAHFKKTKSESSVIEKIFTDELYDNSDTLVCAGLH